MIQVLLVDDEAMIRAGFQAILSAAPVVGAFLAPAAMVAVLVLLYAVNAGRL